MGKYGGSVFDELSAEELAQASRAVSAAGLESARLTAVGRFTTDGPGRGVGRPAAVVELLMARDDADERWERVAPFEQRWALLVVRIVAAVMDPVGAVADARRRGCSWAVIGAALGVSAQAAHERFAARVVPATDVPITKREREDSSVTAPAVSDGLGGSTWAAVTSDPGEKTPPPTEQP